MITNADFGFYYPTLPTTPGDEPAIPIPTDPRHAAHNQYRAIRDQFWTRIMQDPSNPALYERLAAVQAALGDSTDAELSRRIATYLARSYQLQQLADGLFPH